ncbi:uncharacterized protein Dwil_GK19284 [Drosophila willistoni]|uniref:Uncharacterized protein n=1 Tax=Drosophila willistoni TaxID=7260 RepID=B4MM70_DROWI|nr:uncharacterized protein LOC6639142 [Drosophila willistoni]EDW73215.2 uncharacterized protein Dwil_GK19284 [Drosophila willistoni]
MEHNFTDEQNEEVVYYTDEETTEAMDFIKEHQLPMSELLYALKYVRILHGPATGTDEQLMDVQQAPTISPPSPPLYSMQFAVSPTEPVSMRKAP